MHAQTHSAPTSNNGNPTARRTKGRNRRPEITVDNVEHDILLDAGGPQSVLAETAKDVALAAGPEGETLAVSAGQRIERLFQQAQARPQIAIGVVAAAGIVVTTLVWSKVGRLMLLAAGGYVADRLYGKNFRKTVKRLSSKLPAKLTR